MFLIQILLEVCVHLVALFCASCEARECVFFYKLNNSVQCNGKSEHSLVGVFLTFCSMSCALGGTTGAHGTFLPFIFGLNLNIHLYLTYTRIVLTPTLHANLFFSQKLTLRART